MIKRLLILPLLAVLACGPDNPPAYTDVEPDAGVSDLDAGDPCECRRGRPDGGFKHKDKNCRRKHGPH